MTSPVKSRSLSIPPTSAPVRSVRSDEVLSLAEAAKRLGWRVHSTRAAKRQGLRTVRYGSKDFTTGKWLAEFFEQLAAEQEAQPQPEKSDP